jgi:hypothetical protein
MGAGVVSDYKDLIEQAIADKLQAEGSTTAQIEDALTVLTPLCSYKNGMTLLQMPGEAAVSIDTPQAMDTLRRRKPHLFPRVYEPGLAEQAFGERPSFTKRGELVKQIGIEQAEKIAKSYALSGLGDTKPGQEQWIS